VTTRSTTTASTAGIASNFVGTLPELHEVVDLARRGGVPRIPVSEAPLDRLSAGGVTGRMVLTGAAQ
jgi:alcohol dehydrogenase, propanol-preferring